MKFKSGFKYFHSRKCIWKFSSAKWRSFFLDLNVLIGDQCPPTDTKTDKGETQFILNDRVLYATSRLPLTTIWKQQWILNVRRCCAWYRLATQTNVGVQITTWWKHSQTLYWLFSAFPTEASNRNCSREYNNMVCIVFIPRTPRQPPAILSSTPQLARAPT